MKIIDNNSNTWKIECIEVNDIGNDLKIKYLSNEYWQNLELSDKFSNIVLVTNKSIKQLENLKILVDLFDTNDFETTNAYHTKLNIFYDSINIILTEMELNEAEKSNFNYSTLFDSKDLRFKYHRFILNYLEYKYENFSDKIFDDLTLLLIIICNQSNASEDFCIAFHEYKLASHKNGIEIMFCLLEKTSSHDSLDLLLGGLHNISKLNLNYNEIWQDKLKIIQSLAIKYEKNSELKFYCFLIISLLAKDDEMKKISVENTQIISSIVDQLKAVTDNILDKNFKRNKIEINKELIEVASNKNGMYLIEVN